jgi:hypothetical protein
MRCKSLLVTLPIVCGALTSGALSASLDAKLQSHPFYPLTVGSSWKYHEHQSVKAPNTWEIEKKVLSAKELPDGHIRFTVETATVAKPYYHDRVKSYYEVRDGWVVCTGGPDEEYRPPVKVLPPEPKTGITWHTKSALYRRDGKNLVLATTEEYDSQIIAGIDQNANEIRVHDHDNHNDSDDVYERGVGMTRSDKQPLDKMLPEPGDSQTRLVDKHIR